MPLIEFSHRPPNEVLSRAQIYARAWNTEVNRVLASPDADKAARLLNTSDHIVGQLSTASFRTGLTPAQTVAIDQLLNRFGSIANARRPGLERIARSSPKHNPELLSETERKLQTMDLYGVLTELETTGGLEGVRALSFRQSVKDKTRELVDGSPPAAWTSAEKTSFQNLIVDCVEPLFEFGVLQPGAIDARHLTVTDPESLVKCLEKSSSEGSAIQYSIDLNNNPLVNSGTIDDEQYSGAMGVVQAICCGMYHLMKTKDSPGDGRFRTFDRAADSYRDTQATALVDYVCIQHALVVTDKSGVSHPLDIAGMINRFPPDVIKILKYIAKMKASRDDLGQKASNYIQFKDGKSPKLLGRGANKEKWASGYISRSVYKTAQTANNKEHMIALGYMDVRHIPNGPRFSLAGEPLLGLPGTLRAQEIYDKMCLMDATFDYFRPGTSQRARHEFDCEIARWDHDYPALDEFCNRTDGQKAQVYSDARDAWLSIVQEAYKSTVIKMPIDPTKMRLVIEGRLSDLFTKVAILMSYLGPGTNPPPSPELVKYLPFHKIPRAALMFTLRNLIFQIPGNIESRDQVAWFKFSSFGAKNPNKEVFERRKMAIDIIKEQIRKYPSLGAEGDAGTYAYELVQFLSNPWLIEEEHSSEITRSVEWNTVRIAHTSSLRGLSGKQLRNEIERSFSFPFDAVEDKSD